MNGLDNTQKDVNQVFNRYNTIEFDDYISYSKHVYDVDYMYSGYAIIDLIREEDLVIDIGCGINPFKGKIKNLVGIDPIDMSSNNTAGADIITTLEDFRTDKLFDVALCLGSIQFGDEKYISKQLVKMNSLLNTTAKVFWRVKNPNICYMKKHNFIWTFEKLEQYAKVLGFKQYNNKVDGLNNGILNRLYCEWVRN